LLVAFLKVDATIFKSFHISKRDKSWSLTGQS